MCHLCGRWLRLVGGAHLTKMHGLDVATYREMFHLASTTPTCSLQQSSVRRVVTARRAATEPGFGEISAEVRERGARVPRRLGRWRSLAATRPELAAELHPTRNGELDPFAVWPYSSREVWWRCSGCGQEWRDTPAHRSEGRGCPSCTRTAVLAAARTVPRERSLAVINSAVAAELTRRATAALTPTRSARARTRRCGGCAAPADMSGARSWTTATTTAPAARSAVGRRALQPPGRPDGGFRRSARSPRCVPISPPSFTRPATPECAPTNSASAAASSSGGSARAAGRNGKRARGSGPPAAARRAPAPEPAPPVESQRKPAADRSRNWR